MKFHPDCYQIRIRGQLDQRWADWFNGFELKCVEQDTVLNGYVPDQAALHGVFAKIRDLGLVIILVEWLGDPTVGEEK
jgi:hypothetical protein